MKDQDEGQWQHINTSNTLADKGTRISLPLDTSNLQG